MSAKRISVETGQQTSNDGDKDQKIVINSLDYDSLAKIIMLLLIPERIDMDEVCTKWKEACQLAWYDIKKYKCELSIGRCYDNRLLTQSYLEKILLRCGSYLKELSLSDICNSSIMPFVSDHCKNLTSLECEFDVKSLIHNSDDFVQAFTHLDKLKCIKILVNHHRDYNDKTISLFEIINSLPEEINEIHILSKYWWYGEPAVLLTLKKFKKLQKLTLNGLRLDEPILQEIAEITTLVHLDIQIHNKHIRFPLFDKLVNIEYIKIEIGVTLEYVDRRELATKALNTIFCTCKNLKHLDIPPIYYNFDKIPLENWINLQNLEYLCFPCDKLSLNLANAIVKYCKNVKYLSIKYANNFGLINNTAVIKLTELKNLESLILNYLLFELSKKAIIAISNNCKKLKYLELAYCNIVLAGIDDDLSSPSVFKELSKLQYLEHLNLSSSENVKDSTIIAIANNCKNLKSLEIQRCTDITETGLDALTNLKNLEKLKVGFGHISDSFIIRLRGLKELDCCYCRELTDAGIIQFIKNNPDLQLLDVTSIDNITINMVIAADQATKNRTNGIILRIRTNNSSIIEASKSIIKSEWLVVEERLF